METLSDIVAEMRDEMTGTHYVADGMINSLHKAQAELRVLADRIEAAWKRERVEAVGNAAAMYDALVKIAHYCDDKNGMDDPYCADGHILSDIARAALAAPPRQCDVGTASEQRSRFEKFCNSHSWEEIDGTHCRSSCPLYHGEASRCEDFEWAQMPYTEQEEGAQ